MSIFSNFTSDAAMEDNTPTTTSNFGPMESGLYNMAIDMAYVDKSAGGAMNVNFVFKAQSGKELKQTIYVTSGDSKGNLNYYVDKDGNQRYLPGYNTVNSICLLTVGKELADMDTEEKTLSLWSFEHKKEVAQKKHVIMDLIGQEIQLGVLQIIEPKMVKGDNGYVDSGETRTINEIDKVFRTSDNLCVAEIRAKETEATEYERWAKRNEGVTRDKTKKRATGSTGKATTEAPKKSLFG
jgi:hypothetical protein